MQIKPIVSALRRHKAGTILIALQIALTLAIVCNALFIIQQRLQHLSATTGIDEADVFVVMNQWAGQSDGKQIDAQIQSDLLALRQLPAVQDVAPSNSFPLRGGGWDDFITLTPEQVSPTSDAAVYVSDEHFIDTFGIKLIAGRNFNPDEVRPIMLRQSFTPPVVIVSKALADRLYPDGSALGKPLYAMDPAPSTIIGIVDELQTESVGTSQSAYAYQSLIWPLRQAVPQGLYYIVRAKPGQFAAAMREVPKALFDQNRMRIIDPKDGLQTFAQLRRKAYERDRGMAILMGIVCAVLLAITAAGIVGLTSFWVGQRRKQIGIRRALGAQQSDILSYFLTENLLISATGIVIGAVLAVSINLWMVTQFEMAHLSMLYLLCGIVVLLVLGQCAVLAPALRASRVSPIEATRPA